MDFDQSFITASSQETARVGEELGNLLRKKVKGKWQKGIEKMRATVICLYGELGSGKTTFAQGFARGLEITTRLLSPTFIIVRRYPMPHNPGFLYHIDLYRVAGEKDLLGLGLPEILTDPDSVVLVEWAKKLGSLSPRRRIDVHFSTKDDESHEMLLEDIK